MTEGVQMPDEDNVQPQKPSAFFIVSPVKLVVLTMASLGLYTLYWNWRHWQTIRETQGLGIFPIMRALFSIFFIGMLFSRFSKGAAKVGDRFASWQPFVWAFAYIFISIGSSLISEYHNQHPQPPFLILFGLIFLQLIVTTVSLKAQVVANYASGDETGESNIHYNSFEKILLFVSIGLWLMFLSAIFISP